MAIELDKNHSHSFPVGAAVGSLAALSLWISPPNVARAVTADPAATMDISARDEEVAYNLDSSVQPRKKLPLIEGATFKQAFGGQQITDKDGVSYSAGAIFLLADGTEVPPLTVEGGCSYN